MRIWNDLLLLQEKILTKRASKKSFIFERSLKTRNYNYIAPPKTQFLQGDTILRWVIESVVSKIFSSEWKKILSIALRRQYKNFLLPAFSYKTESLLLTYLSTPKLLNQIGGVKVKKGPVKNTSKILQCHQNLVIYSPPIPMNQYLTAIVNNQFLLPTKLIGE